MPALRALLLVTGFAGITFLVAGALVHTAYQSQVLPGVHAEALRISGLTAGEVRDVLDVAANPLLAAPAVFYHGEREWHPTATEMGLSVDTMQMARDATTAGRNGLPLLRWFQEALTPLQRPNVPLRAEERRSPSIIRTAAR